MTGSVYVNDLGMEFVYKDNKKQDWNSYHLDHSVLKQVFRVKLRNEVGQHVIYN